MNDEKQPQPLPEQEPVGEVEGVEQPPALEEIPQPLDFWMRLIDESLQVKILWFLKTFNLEIINETSENGGLHQSSFYVRERTGKPIVKSEDAEKEHDYVG